MSPGRGSGRAIEVLSRLVSERGAPKQLRWDNGSWRVVLKWLVDQGIDIGFIDPSKPCRNDRQVSDARTALGVHPQRPAHS